MSRVLCPIALLAALALSLSACQGLAPSGKPQGPLPFLAGALAAPALGQSLPELGRGGQGLRVQVKPSPKRQLHAYVGTPWTLNDVAEVRYTLRELDTNAVVATRTDPTPGGFDPDAVDLVLRHLKPNLNYSLGVEFRNADNEVISDPNESVATLFEEQGPFHDFTVGVVFAKPIFPGLLDVQVGIYLLYVREVTLVNVDDSYAKVASAVVPAGQLEHVTFKGLKPGTQYVVDVARYSTNPFPDEITQSEPFLADPGEASEAGFLPPIQFPAP